LADSTPNPAVQASALLGIVAFASTVTRRTGNPTVASVEFAASYLAVWEAVGVENVPWVGLGLLVAVDASSVPGPTSPM